MPTNMKIFLLIGALAVLVNTFLFVEPPFNAAATAYDFAESLRHDSKHFVAFMSLYIIGVFGATVGSIVYKGLNPNWLGWLIGGGIGLGIASAIIELIKALA